MANSAIIQAKPKLAAAAIFSTAAMMLATF